MEVIRRDESVIQNINQILRENTYPGRGIVMGISADGSQALAAYFTMGRSTNSRNRIFVEKGDRIENEAYDPSLLTDPSLVIYAPVCSYQNQLIVTNGDQTDTVFKTLKQGKTFEDAIRTRRFEPDAPNYTPRISGLLQTDNGRANYKLSIIKNMGHHLQVSVQRFFFEYPEPIVGTGHLIHTYEKDGPVLPSFDTVPVAVHIGCDTVAAFAENIWKSLDSENKVSLFVRSIDLKNGKSQTILKNKNLGD